MKKKHKRLVRLAVTAVAGAVVWWAGDHWLVKEPQAVKKKHNLADYVIEEFSATRLDQSGKPLHQLHASSYEFFENSKQANLVRPHLVQYDANRIPTSTTADHGVLDTSSRVLQMKGNVVVRQGKLGDRGPVQLKTNELVVELQ